MTQLDIRSPSVAHGIGLFETMLVVRGKLILAPEHYERMARSASEIGFPIPGERRFHEAVQAAAREVASQAEAAVRCVYTAGGRIGDAGAWQLAAEGAPIPPVTLLRRAHGRTMTVDGSYTRALPQHKLTSYAVCVIALQRAVAAGADEALFTAPGDVVLEGTATNVFAVCGDTLITAPHSAGVLPGTIRAWLLAEANRCGIAVEERAPTLAELHQGAFLTGSLTQLVPIRTLNGATCRVPGRPFTALAEQWTRFLV